MEYSGNALDILSVSTTIVIPCYNEADRLDLSQVTSYSENHGGDRFLFVDDGSTDNTAAILEAYCHTHADTATLMRLGTNRGKGEAVRRGVVEALNSPSDFVAFWDADFAAPLHCLTDLARHMTANPDVRIVMGARVKMLGFDIGRRAIRHYSGRIFATAVALGLKAPIYDTQCGAKLFRNDDLIARVFSEPFLSRWIFDVEILARFLKISGIEPSRMGDLVKEQPLSTWHDVPGSKIGVGAGVRALFDLARIWWKEM